MGYQWISRFLANGLVCCDDVMAPFAREILARLAESGEPIPLILDQTKASDRHQILMLSVRWGERALPLAWRVAETEGAIGFATQQELLEVVAGWLSVGQAVIPGLRRGRLCSPSSTTASTALSFTATSAVSRVLSRSCTSSVRCSAFRWSARRS
jgi:hypothetical protein